MLATKFVWNFYRKKPRAKRLSVCMQSMLLSWHIKEFIKTKMFHILVMQLPFHTSLLLRPWNMKMIMIVKNWIVSTLPFSVTWNHWPGRLNFCFVWSKLFRYIWNNIKGIRWICVSFQINGRLILKNNLLYIFPNKSNFVWKLKP